VYAVVDDTLSPTSPLGDSLDVFGRREDAERFIEEVRGDDPELAKPLRIEERELQRGGRNYTWVRVQVKKERARADRFIVSTPSPDNTDVEPESYRCTTTSTSSGSFSPIAQTSSADKTLTRSSFSTSGPATVLQRSPSQRSTRLPTA
jgi:hypothetical protein